MKTISIERIQKLLPYANTDLMVDRSEWCINGEVMPINDVIVLEVLLAPDDEQEAIRALLKEFKLI